MKKIHLPCGNSNRNAKISNAFTTSNLTACSRYHVPGGQKISHEIEAICATQPASPRWHLNHEILWHRKIAGHKPVGMTRLVCVLLLSNAIMYVVLNTAIFNLMKRALKIIPFRVIEFLFTARMYRTGILTNKMNFLVFVQ